MALGIASIALANRPAPAAAHPLGNFTINHYSGIRVSTDQVLIDHVTDFAEIPTITERQAIDVDLDGQVSDGESAAYQRATCEALIGQLLLTRAGQDLELEAVETGLTFYQGQGALTSRLVCVYRSAVEPVLAAPTEFTFADRSYPERIGWREIVVQGDGTSVTTTDAFAATTSQRLTVYPSGLLDRPLDMATASWTTAPGGATLPPFDVPDAAPPADPAAPSETPVASGQGSPAPTVQPGPGATPGPGPAVPGGISELGGELGRIFQTRDLTLPIVALSAILAAALGAFHALTPGHGKTVMAAYLVGTRGSVRHAVGLGLTVTISHTLGVLALGVLSLTAASFLPPERLYPVLGVISGVLVILIGLYLIYARVRDARRERALEAAHATAHARGEEHEHGRDHEHEHDHGHEDLGWHSHGGARHTHLPAGGASLSWRGLFALGLAGGMVPSVSALILLLGSISLGRPAYGILLTICFGIGMAVILVGIGMLLVYARGLLERMPVRSSGARLARLLPTATAVIVLAAGVIITGQALLSF